MKRIIPLAIIMALVSCGRAQQTIEADPMIGTGFHGHTYPGAAAPYGMVQLSPDTRTEGWDACSGYHYDDNTIIGFSHTHLSGTGCADLADILFHPSAESPEKSGTRYGIDPYTFNHKDETAKPGYWAVKLPKAGLVAELTATQHVGIHRYIYSGSGRYILIDLNHALSDDKVDQCSLRQISDTEICGMRRTQGWVENQAIHFYARFSRPIISFNDAERQALLEFAPDADTLTAAVGISAVSIENAKLNLDTEVPELDFDQVREQTEETWRTALSGIRVKGGTEKQRRIFATALYHTKVTPNVMSDVNGQYIRHDGSIGTMPEGRKYWSTFSIWDTFRAWHPLQTLTDTAFVNDMVLSFMEMYDASGELPIWPLWSGETGTMIGYHSVSVIADAYLRGVRGFDAEAALKAMVRSSNINKKGSVLYNEFGFVPSDVKKEAVSLTLEYAYDDWCIARMAEELGHEDIAKEYYRRATNYVNVFDGSTSFFRGRNRDGSRTTPFDIFSTGRDYTEATPWHYRFFAPHDVNGLIQLFGGREQFIKALDDLFTLESDELTLDVSDVSGLKGQYAHGNEPSHNFAYLYSYAGQPWKTQELTRELLDEMYDDTPDGIIGNEDCGQMSAWYVMSSLGFYSVCPGTGEYVLTTPLFDEAEMIMANGKVLTIKANNPARNRYIKSVTLNGRPLNTTFITYAQLLEGGVLEYELSRKPVKNIDLELPYSLSTGEEASVPYTTSEFSLFIDSVDFTLGTTTREAEIRYTLDGSEPDSMSMLYDGAIRLDASTVVSARTFREGFRPSRTVRFNAEKAEFIPGVQKSGLAQGVRYRFHDGRFASVAEMCMSKVTRTGTMPEPSINDAGVEDYFGYEFEGYIDVPEKAVWEFVTKSDDGSVLYIDGRKVVDNDGSHAAVAATGRIALDKGLHKFTLLYFEDYEGQELTWGWKRSGETDFRPIDRTSLYYE